jgi:hypothetical protein
MKRLCPFLHWHRSVHDLNSSLVAGIILLTALLGAAIPASAQPGFTTSGRVIKWDQPPELATPTNVFYGWNEPSIYNVRVAADDWVCTTTNPVKKIRWWGSFIGWTDTNAAPVLPFDFRIHFWTDQPKNAANPFSHPATAIWQIICTNFTWRCVGQDYDPRTGTFETCFLFEQTLNPQEWFHQIPAATTNIFWLSIAADYPTGMSPFPFGWKTRPRSPTSPAPDAAVVINNPNNPVLGSLFIAGFPILWPLTNEWDLAFELITTGGITNGPAKWEQLPDLTPLGIDVNASQQPPPPYLLADDFLCVTPGFITNITIWGSWFHDQLPMGPQGFPSATNVMFLISIHDDIPAAQSPTGYSMPGPLRRLFSMGPSKYTHSILASNIQEGWLNPPGGFTFPGDTVCHQYDLRFGPNDDPFFQDGTPTSPKVFWLDVQAVIPTIPQTNVFFGWKTSVTNWNDAAVWVNAVEPFVGIWNILLYPPGHPKFGTNIHLAFRINSGSVSVDTPKWSQPPTVATNSGNWYNGWNEPSIDGGGIWMNMLLTNIVADDWLCTNARPVTDIHWWGSFLDWTGTDLPPQPPVAFHLAIWTDVPQGPNVPFSHPRRVLWDHFVPFFDPMLRGKWVGWDLDPRHPCLDVESCFKFDLTLPRPVWFYQTNNPPTNIFWLSISAVYPAGIPISNPFGWKTRPHVPVPPDDAVRIFEPLSPSPGVVYVNGEPIEYPPGTSWDMAFRLTTCQPYPLTNLIFTSVALTNFGANQVITMKWNSQPGAVYQLQEASTLTNTLPGFWMDIGAPIIGPVDTIVMTNSASYFSRFYRLYLPDICP